MSRYIDADRLKTDFAGTLVALERKPKFDGLQIILIRCVFDMIGKIVDNAPTVDAVPDRKVGKWIVVKRHEHYPSGKPYDQVQCPFCKRFDNNGDGNFCGYCGARMDGERKDDE